MANNIGINAVKKVIQELVVPELQTIKDDLKDVKGDVKGLQVEINRLDGKIDSLHNEMNIRFEATDEKIEDKIESRDRLAALESKVATLAAQINSR